MRRSTGAPAGDGEERVRDTEVARHFGPAALVVGAFDLGVDFLGTAVDALRDEGRLGHLPGCSCSTRAWRRGSPIGTSRSRLRTRPDAWRKSSETRRRRRRGHRRSRSLPGCVATRTRPSGPRHRRSGSQCRRAPTSPSPSRSSAGSSQPSGRADTPTPTSFAERLFDPADSAYHPVISSWLIGDLAEAALHLDRVEEARARVEQVETPAGESPAAGLRSA